MRTTVIPLDIEDNVISACDKMDWCKTGRIVLVMPKRGGILHQKLDLVILLRHSQSLGAQLALVSLDEMLRASALELGIPMFESAEQAQRRPWRRSYLGQTINVRSDRKKLPLSISRGKPQVLFGLRNPWIRWGAFLTGMIAVAAIMMIFLPFARITIQEIPARQKIQFPMWASVGVAEPNPGGSISAIRHVVIVEASEQSSSTSQVNVNFGFSSGEVTFTNLAGVEIVVPKGTIVTTLGNSSQRFTIEYEITIPITGKKQQAVSVRALLPGSDGNVPAGSIQAIEGSLGGKLTVSNPSALRGGENHWAAAPGESDYRTLRSLLLDTISKLAARELAAGLSEDEFLIIGTQKLERVIEEVRQPLPGIPSPIAQLTIKAEISALAINKRHIDLVVAESMDASYSPKVQPIPKTLSWIFESEPKINGERIEWVVIAEEETLPDLDSSQVASIMAGKLKTEMQSLMKTVFGLSEKPRVEVFPGWWPWLPLAPFRIEVIQ